MQMEVCCREFLCGCIKQFFIVELFMIHRHSTRIIFHVFTILLPFYNSGMMTVFLPLILKQRVPKMSIESCDVCIKNFICNIMLSSSFSVGLPKKVVIVGRGYEAMNLKATIYLKYLWHSSSWIYQYCIGEEKTLFPTLSCSTQLK